MARRLVVLPVVIFMCLTAGAQINDRASREWFLEFMSRGFGGETKLPLNGVYCTFRHRFGETRTHSLYLYQNGSYFEEGEIWPITADTLALVDKIVVADRKANVLGEFWGLYKVMGDSLITIRVGMNAVFPGSYTLVTSKWLISKGSVINISETYCARERLLRRRTSETVVEKDRFPCKFYSSNESKPDSTKAWFFQEKWFQY